MDLSAAASFWKDKSQQIITMLESPWLYSYVYCKHGTVYKDVVQKNFSQNQFIKKQIQKQLYQVTMNSLQQDYKYS